jgi:predicted RND superfamily exporter protein
MVKFGRPLFNRPIDIAILLALTMAAAWSALVLPRLRVDPSMSSSLTRSGAANSEQREYMEATALFPDEKLVLVSLPCGDPYAPVSVARLKALSAALEAARVANSAVEPWKLYSPTTVEDFVLRGGTLASVPLCGPVDGGQELAARLAASPLLSKLFLSSDGTAWTLILAVSAPDDELLPPIESLRSAFPEIRIAGMPYYAAVNEKILQREFVPLLACAAAALLLIELIILRAFGPAIFLWAFSLLPTLLLMGLFVLTGTPMRLQYVLAPVLTLSLTNSYVTHVYRGWAEGGFDPRGAIRSRAKIVFLDALTTVLGFGSLFISPIRELVVLGAFAIAGAAFSVLVGLVALPAALGLVGRPSAADRRFAASEGEGLRPIRRRWPRIGAWAAVCAVLGLFTLRIESGLDARDQFLPWSDRAKEAVFFDEAYRGLGEASLIVTTGKENGFVDLVLFRSLSALELDLAALPDVGSVYGPTDLVKESLARWEGGPELAVEPRSEADIGESLELLSNAGGGLFSRGFVDPGWSSAKIRISVSPGFKAASDYPQLRARAEKAIAARLPGVKVLWAGEVAKNSIDQRAFIQGQVSGGLSFFAFLFVGLCIVFRSIPRAFAVSIVPMTGFLASISIMGILGWRLSPVHAIALATIAGTGVDNAIVLVLRGWTAEARDATVDTTLLIVLSMSVLLLCSSFLVVQTAIVCIAGLVASTATAVLVLPAMLGPKGNSV